MSRLRRPFLYDRCFSATICLLKTRQRHPGQAEDEEGTRTLESRSGLPLLAKQQLQVKQQQFEARQQQAEIRRLQSKVEALPGPLTPGVAPKWL